MEGDIEGEGGGEKLKTTASNRFTLMQLPKKNAQFDTPDCDKPTMFHVSWHTQLEADNACPEENQLNWWNQMKTITQLTDYIAAQTNTPWPLHKLSTPSCVQSYHVPLEAKLMELTTEYLLNLSSWTASLLSFWTASPLSSRTTWPLSLWTA